MFFRAFSFPDSVPSFHELLGVYREPTALACILLERTIVAEDPAAFKTIVGGHLDFFSKC